MTTAVPTLAQPVDNPTELADAIRALNTQSRYLRGLREQDVVYRLQMGERQSALAELYGVDKMIINRIAMRMRSENAEPPDGVRTDAEHPAAER